MPTIRGYCRIGAAALIFTCAWSSLSMAADDSSSQPFRPATFVYREVDGTRVEADVFAATGEAPRPVLVWIHGGALIVGTRLNPPQRLVDLSRKENWSLVSIDYRLAPESQLPEVVSDVEHALLWIRQEGPKLFHADPKRIVISGGSAGGYLTMLMGTRAAPRPRALLAYWGYGDLTADWYALPSKHYRETMPLVDEGEARSAIGKKPLTGTPDAESSKARGRFYHFTRQTGRWPLEVASVDVRKNPEKLAAYCPLKNLSSDYPPILMIHGTVDTDVPYEESANMARELKRLGRPHELFTVEGAGHGLSGGDKDLVEKAHAAAERFLKAQLADGP